MTIGNGTVLVRLIEPMVFDPASVFLKHIGRIWPNPDWSFNITSDFLSALKPNQSKATMKKVAESRLEIL